MSTLITCHYLGDLQTEACHSHSGIRLRTDAPLDNNGKARSFSPTDLLGTALITCLLTIMAIAARNHGFELEPCPANVVKTMGTTGPRRVETLAVQVALPPGLSLSQRQLLMEAARTCPVSNSIGAGINITVEFVNHLDDLPG